MKIRSVEPKDYEAIHALIQEAYAQSKTGYNVEVELVKVIRTEPTYNPNLEIVAIEDDQIVGHGILSEIAIGIRGDIGLAMAPLVVKPSYQGKGIGKALLQELEERARKYGYGFISVMDLPKYYEKFGYEPTSKYDITAPFTVPQKAYMIKAIKPHGLDGVRGQIDYLPKFGI